MNSLTNNQEKLFYSVSYAGDSLEVSLAPSFWLDIVFISGGVYINDWHLNADVGGPYI